MSSEKLNSSLDAILVNNRQTTRQSARRRGNQRGGARRAAVGGVRKNTRAAGKGIQTGPSAPPTESKIIVSGLPSDVNEANIKEYFTKAAGPVKRVMLTYNQNGTSRGIASIVFSKPDTAAHAAKELNGLLVDGRPMRIEVVLDAARAPETPAPKPLTERVVQKSKPRPATDSKAGAAGKRGRRARGGRNPNRTGRKTVEELDAEMVDYFAGGENGGQAAGNAPNGAQPAAGGGEDQGMAEIS